VPIRRTNRRRAAIPTTPSGDHRRAAITLPSDPPCQCDGGYLDTARLVPLLLPEGRGLG
jgi:hypothetical protein